MKAWLRLALNLLSPPVIVALWFTMLAGGEWRTFCYLLIYSLALAMLPGLGHAVIMALCYEAGLEPRSALAAGISGCSGLVAGAVVAVPLFWWFGHATVSGLLYVAGVGAAAGVFTALLIAALERLGDQMAGAIRESVE